MALQAFVGPWPLFGFLILYTVGRTPWTGDQPVAMPLPVHRITQTQNIRPQTSTPQVGFEPTIPAYEWAKTVHALDRAAFVSGIKLYARWKYGAASALDKDNSSTSGPGRFIPGIHYTQKFGWTRESVWTLWRRQKSRPCRKFEARSLGCQFLSQRH
jgi:hypothetical protein